MKLPKITFDYQFFSRLLIGLLFIIAGLSKIGVFSPQVPHVQVFKNFYNNLHLGITFLPITLEPFVGLAVILIEIPIAILYIFNIKKKWTGGLLVIFTALVTVFFHNPIVLKPTFGLDFVQFIQALKNIAIIGGIFATLDCGCRECVVIHESHKTTKRHA